MPCVCVCKGCAVGGGAGERASPALGARESAVRPCVRA